MTKRRKPRKTIPALAAAILQRALERGYLDRIFRVRCSYETRMRDLAADMVRPYMPHGLCQWALLPVRREAGRKYACRFVEYAVRRAWNAGGFRSLDHE